MSVTVARKAKKVAGADQHADLVDQLLSDWKRERPDLNAKPLAIVGRILHLGTLLAARATDCLRETGISYTEFDVLATLRRSGPPYRMTPTTLRKSVLLTSGAMTACLDRLERRELIVRHADPIDRRSLGVSLTKPGIKLINEIVVLRFDEAKNSIAGLNAEEQSQLSHLLRRLTNEVEK